MTLVKGIDIRKDEPGCGHWRTERDIVAIKFPCCGEFYACFDCHAALTGHAPGRWPETAWQTEKAILCRACKTAMTIAAYRDSGNTCPSCGSAFNPGCKNHWHLYFEGENPPCE
jgi:uncharacterized CHY-type Zn-finger protein